MGIVNRDGALYMATGIDNSGLYAGRREAMGIIKAMTSQVTSFDVFAGIGISAATAFASAAKSSYDFEKEFRKNMLEVATISTQVTNDMTGFMNQVMAITQEIPIKAPEAAKALYQIVSAGHDGAAGMKILEVSAKSAVGGLTDTATAADAITTVLNAYKMSADQAENISDQLFTTVRLGKTTFGELGQSIAQVAPIAASYGVEIDQVLAAVASLTKQGTPTAQAMTQIRAAIIGTSKVLGDGAFKYRTFQEALAEVATRANGSESKLRELVPEVEAVNGVLGMTGKNAKAAASDLSELQGAAGATQAAFEKMKDEVGNQMTLLSNNIQVALRPMGEKILKEVSEVAEAFNEAFKNGDVERSLSSLKTLLELTAVAWGTYKVSVAAAMVIENLRYQSSLAHMQGLTKIQALLTILKGKTDALTASMLKNPYALMAAAVAALGYGLYKLWTYQTQAQKNQKKLNETIIEFNAECLKEERSMNQLFDALGRANKGTVERKKIIDTINTQYGKYLPNLLTEESSLDDINAAYKAINTSLKEQIALKIRNTATDKIVTKGVQTQAGAISKMRKELNGRIKKSATKDLIIDEIKRTTEEFQKSGSTWEKAWNQAYANVRRKYSGKIKLGNEFASSMEDYVKSVFDTESAVSLIEKQYAPFINKIQVENEKVEDAVEGKSDRSVVDEKTLQKQKELSRLILDSELKLQADRIAIMKNGKDKRVLLADQEYKETLATIQKEREEYQKKVKEMKGTEDPAVLSTFTDRENSANDKRNNDVANIAKEYSDQLKAIQNDVDSHFRSQLDNRLIEIDSYYKEQIKIAKEAGEEEEGDFIKMLIRKQQAERDYARKESALSTVDFREQVDIGHLENRSDDTYFVEETERKKTEILRKYALERITILESMGDEQSRKEAELLKIAVEGYDKALSKPSKKSINKLIDEKAIKTLQKRFVELGMSEEDAKEKAIEYAEGFKGKMQMVSDVTESLKTAFGGISDELDMALDAVSNIAQGFAEGGLIGGISAAAGQLISVVGNLFTAKKEIDKSMVEGYETYMDAINDLIDTQVALLDKLGGMAFGQNIIDTTKDIAKSIAASRTLFNEAMGAGAGLFSHSDGYKANKMLKGYVKELREVGIYTTDLSRMTNEQLASLKKLPEVYARLPEGLRKYIDAIAEGIDKTEEFKDQIQDTVLGLDFTSIADMIVNSLTDPSIDNALEELETNIDKTIASIVQNMLRRNMLLGPLEKMTNELYKSMEKKDKDGNTYYKLTAESAKNFKDNVLGLGKQFQDAWKELEEAFSAGGIDLMPKEQNKTDDTSDNSLKGAFAKADQETIGLLAGQTGAVRALLEDMKNSMQPIRDQIQRIYEMQVRGWEDVKAIRDLTDKVNKNSEQVANNTKMIHEVASKISDNTIRTVDALEGTLNVKVKM